MVEGKNTVAVQEPPTKDPHLTLFRGMELAAK
jgi:hypothetical protein